jgi:hypothetical protein
MAYGLFDTDRLLMTDVKFQKFDHDIPANIKQYWIPDQWLIDYNNSMVSINDHFCTQYAALMSPAQIPVLRNLMRMLKPHSVVVEVGSFCGGSAKISLEILDPTTRYYCIDHSWKHELQYPEHALLWLSDDPWTMTLDVNFNVKSYSTGFAFAKYYLRDHKNVQLLPLDSPNDISWWAEPIDIYYDDSDHSNPGFRHNLNFWVPLVKSGGIISGHDYSDSFPDIIKESNDLARRLGTTITVSESIWWIIKP